MDTIEVKVIVNQRRQTRWLKDYHESYRKKAGGEKECSRFRNRKRKKGVKRKSRKDRVSCTAKKAALAIFV